MFLCHHGVYSCEGLGFGESLSLLLCSTLEKVVRHICLASAGRTSCHALVLSCPVPLRLAGLSSFLLMNRLVVSVTLSLDIGPFNSQTKQMFWLSYLPKRFLTLSRFTQRWGAMYGVALWRPQKRCSRDFKIHLAADLPLTVLCSFLIYVIATMTFSSSFLLLSLSSSSFFQFCESIKAFFSPFTASAPAVPLSSHSLPTFLFFRFPYKYQAFRETF